MIAVLEELGVRDAFDVRATREAADCLANRRDSIRSRRLSRKQPAACSGVIFP